MSEHSLTSTPGAPPRQVGVSCSLGSGKGRVARRAWRILHPVASVVVVGLFAYVVWDAARPVARVQIVAATGADGRESIETVPLPQSLSGTVVSLDGAVKIRSMSDTNRGNRCEASGTAVLSLPPFLALHSARSLAVLVTLTPQQAWRAGLGRRAHVAIDGRQKACEGMVDSIYGSLERTGGRFEAYISLAAAPSRLLPGMKARVSFRDSDKERERRSVVLIPRDALIGADGDQAAFWVIGADNLLQRRQALRRPAWDDAARVAVLGGVRPGELVVLSLDTSLREGQRVTTD